MWTYDKNGPAQMATRYVKVGRKNRRKEKGTTENPMGRHVKEGSRGTKVTNSQKHNFLNIDISTNSSPSD